MDIRHSSTEHGGGLICSCTSKHDVGCNPFRMCNVCTYINVRYINKRSIEDFEEIYKCNHAQLAVPLNKIYFSYYTEFLSIGKVSQGILRLTTIRIGKVLPALMMKLS